jgi:hypothetical protein
MQLMAWFLPYQFDFLDRVIVKSHGDSTPNNGAKKNEEM